MALGLEAPKIIWFPLKFFATAEANDFKIGMLLGLGEPQNFFRSPLNIYATAEANDFIFGTHLRFAKVHQRIT